MHGDVHELVAADAQLVPVACEVFVDEIERKRVIAGRHGCVRRKDRLGFDLLECIHEGDARGDQLTGQFEHQECRVSFVHVPDRRCDAQLTQCAYTAHTQHQLLGHTHIVISAVQAGRQFAVARAVGVDVGVHQIEGHATDVEFVDFGVDGATGQLDLDHDFVTVGRPRGEGGDVGEAHLGVDGLLPAAVIEALPEVALWVDEPHRHKRQIEVTGFFHMVARQNTQTTRVDGQRFVDAELGRKVRNRGFLGGVGALEPGLGIAHVCVKRSNHGIVIGHPERVIAGGYEILLTDIAEELDWVVVDFFPQ